MKTSGLLPEECREEIRTKLSDLEHELARGPDDPVVVYSDYWRRKLKDWKVALAWVLGDDGK